MSEALKYHASVSLKNMVRRTLKRPLKTIGFVLVFVYFLFMPFIMKNMLVDFGFANPRGFVLIGTAFSLYISMPMTLTYFKRNGIVFRKQDVNFMFATPLSPKKILIYALVKQSYMTILMQVVVVIAAVFVFNIPVLTSIVFGCVNLVVSNLLQYSLALVLYGSERISDSVKRSIKWGVYVILALASIFIAYYFFQNGLSVETALSLVNHPVILMVPIFGWELGWLNLMILGANPVVVTTTILFFVSAVVMAYLAYTMVCTGQYYEDGMKFSQRQARLEAKQGNVTLNELRGKARKTYKYQGGIKGSFASVMFSRQIIERRRTRKFFLGFADLLVLLIGIVIAVISMREGEDASIYFAIVVGISMYCAVFFAPNPTWKDEYSAYFLFVIPDTMWRKLFFSTSLEHLLSLLISVLLALATGLIMKASFFDLIFAIVAQVMIKMMITYKSILVDGFFGAKIGKGLAQLVSMFMSVLLMIVPIIGIVFSVLNSSAIGFMIISIYSLLMIFALMYFCTRVLRNIESLQ